jgi:hypothetical protein
MAKYKNIKELAQGFKSGELKDWVLIVDNDSTYLRWIGDGPESEEFEDQKSAEGRTLWGSPDFYILDQALTAAGIPNEGV